MTRTTGDPGRFDAESVHAKYQEERAKRLIEGRALIQDLAGDERFASYLRDPFTPRTERAPVFDDVAVAIVGAGIAGVVLGAKLRDVGVARIRLIDKAGGIGGTWYWNRYPGLYSDVESYVYMPLLEEMDYIPSSRYATGDEIRRHLDAIAHRYHLVEDALFHTGVETSAWNETLGRWVLQTDREDEIRARYLVHAVGILNLMQLPKIPGMEEYEGKAFHTARWDYEYTGGAPDDPRLTKLADKVVGLLGTGGSAIQALPPLAESSKHLYVFQRTPSAIGVRDNRPTEAQFDEQCRPGWQRERMENFSAVMIGRPVDDVTDDGWTHHMAKVANPSIDPAMSLDEIMLKAEEFDYAVMEEHRTRIEHVVSDPTVAEALKPYYRYLCKRPLFHDEYLPSFNRPNVTLVNCPRGVERVTTRGVVAEGTAYELDCIVYATGFEPEITPFARRAGHTIVGRNGVTMAEKWKDGPTSLHGLMTRGFPNMFVMPAPGQQAVTTVNYTHLAVVGAGHIAATIALLDQRGVAAFHVSQAAEDAWTDAVVGAWRDSSAFIAACTPSRINFQSDPSRVNPRNGSYGGGSGDVFRYQDLLAEWRERGDFEGLDVEPTAGPS
jgi:cation diffusion facilitator CzcD-associated flavoprotein CzcO